MKKYLVELTAHLYSEVEVEAENEDQAVEFAYNIADNEVRNEEIDWDVDYVEELDE